MHVRKKGARLECTLGCATIGLKMAPSNHLTKENWSLIYVATLLIYGSGNCHSHKVEGALNHLTLNDVLSRMIFQWTFIYVSEQFQNISFWLGWSNWLTFNYVQTFYCEVAQTCTHRATLCFPIKRRVIFVFGIQKESPFIPYFFKRGTKNPSASYENAYCLYCV